MRGLLIWRPPVRRSDRDAQSDSIVGSVHEILLRPKVSLRSLYRNMPEKQLNLLQLATRCPAHLRAATPQIMGCDSVHAGSICVRLQQLPDNLLAQCIPLDVVRPVHPAEDLAGQWQPLGFSAHVKSKLERAGGTRMHYVFLAGHAGRSARIVD